jgi:uncharacterized protein YbjT (DUF2867 family)
MKKIILVTGATGKQGSAVVRHALRQGFTVRALTRNPDSLTARALLAKGVEVVKGDMEDLASLRQAMKDVYGVFSVQNYWEKNVGYDGEIRQATNLASETARHSSSPQRIRDIFTKPYTLTACSV